MQTAYSESFTDQAKCKEIALNQIAAGSGAVFQAAGSCGLGALQGAKEKGVWGIGVDTDQGFLGPVRPHERDQEGRPRRLPDGAGRQERHLQGRRGCALHRQERRRRVRQGEHQRPNRAKIIAKLTAVSKLIASGKINPPKK